MYFPQSNLADTTVVQSNHLVEGTYTAEPGPFAVYDDEGHLACEVWIDAIPGLDVYAFSALH